MKSAKKIGQKAMMSDEEEQEVKRYVADLIECGALVLNGIDNMGEPVYIMNREVMMETCPEFVLEVASATENAMQKLYINGQTDFYLDENNTPIWFLTERGLEFYDDIERAITDVIEMTDLLEEEL